MAKNNRGLGMGLDALLKMNIQEEVADENTGELKEQVIAGFAEVPIDSVFPNPGQPRKTFDEEALENLAQSIRSFGIIQPITVSRSEHGYEIIAGERRYRAAKLAGLQKVPVIIKDLAVKQKLEMALVENIQRENLNPIEEGLAYLHLIETYHITQEELSQELGKSRTAITNTMRLLNLDPVIQSWLREGKISQGHARTVLALADKKEQSAFASYIIQNNLSVREAEQLSKKWPIEVKSRKISSTSSLRELEVQKAEEKMASMIQAKVNIVGTSKKGKIQIEYFTQEELERILELMGVDLAD